MNWMTELFIPLVMLFASSLMGYIIWILQQQRKEQQEIRKVTAQELNAIKDGLVLLLRENIITAHVKYVEEKTPMMALAYDNICEIYEKYKTLGGNGMADKLMKDLERAEVKRGART